MNRNGIRFTLYTAISIFMLMSCISLKNNKSKNHYSFFFERDTTSCKIRDFENLKVDIEGYEYIGGKKVHLPNQRYHLLLLNDSFLFFQLNDTLFSLNRNTSFSKKIGLNEHHYMYFLYRDSKQFYFATDHNIVYCLDPTTNQLSRVADHLPTDGGSRFGCSTSRIIKLPNQNKFLFTLDEYTYLVDAALHKIDSFVVPYAYYERCDFFYNKILAQSACILDDSKNKIFITDYSSRKTTSFDLPNNNVKFDFKINGIYFSRSDSNKIYYCQNNAGIYSYNIKTKENLLIAESCPNRNFQDFIVSKNEHEIIAQANNNIYTIQNKIKEGLGLYILKLIPE
jgi:hypothetical protein